MKLVWVCSNSQNTLIFSLFSNKYFYWNMCLDFLYFQANIFIETYCVYDIDISLSENYKCVVSF